MWGCSLEHEGKQEEEDLKARGLASPAPSGPGAAGRGRCGPGAAPPFPHGGQPGPGGLQRGAEGGRCRDPVRNYPLGN